MDRARAPGWFARWSPVPSGRCKVRLAPLGQHLWVSGVANPADAEPRHYALRAMCEEL